jgi:crotonobetainyl-CoA:carnitine CoA-transferase CaiB-like acyl-CoA transferase
MTAMLDGLVVVELAGERTEWCGKLFSQAGARVILVETPGGAAGRTQAPFYQQREDIEHSLHFWHYNTDKESVVLDLASSVTDRETFLRLLGKADILVDGSEPGELAAIGLPREAIERSNPKLVHVAVTAFGQDGPWASLQATDLVHLALGGQMMMNGYDDMPESPPIAGAGNQALHIAGTWAFIAALSSLYGGGGCFVDLSVHEACAGMTELALPNYDYNGRIVSRQTGRHASIERTTQMQFPTSDGRHVRIELLNQLIGNWDSLVEWLESEGMAEDFADPMYYVPEFFVEHAQHIFEVIGRFCATKSGEELFHGMQQRGQLLADVNYPEDHLADPHLEARGFWNLVEHDLYGTMRFPGSPYVARESEISVRRRAPRLNEHDAEIRQLAGS